MPNLFDPDSTHDRLWAEKIPEDMLALLSNALTTDHSFFSAPLPIALIERVIVGENLPWAEDWVDRVFEFMVWLSQCSVLFDEYLNGEFFGFEYPTAIELPPALSVTVIPDQVTLSIPANASRFISWLERSDEVPSGQFCGQVTNPISVWIRRGKQFRAGSSALSVNLDSRHWLFNSVVTDASWVGLQSPQVQALEYQYLGQRLEAIKSQFNLPAIKFLENFNLWRAE